MNTHRQLNDFRKAALVNPEKHLLISNRPNELPSSSRENIDFPCSDKAIIPILLEKLNISVRAKNWQVAKELHHALSLVDTKNNELTGCLKYYEAMLALADGESEVAKQSLEESIQISKYSFSYFQLAEVLSSSDPLIAWGYYNKSLAAHPNLNEESRAHAQNWCNEFFDPKVYILYNPDLSHLDKSCLAEHFKEFGFHEGRIGGRFGVARELNPLKDQLPSSFRWSDYLILNEDLKSLVDVKQHSLLDVEYILTKHYLEHGRYENRLFYVQNLATDNHVASETPYQHAKHYLARKYREALDSFLASGSSLTIGSANEPLITIIIIVFNKAEFTLQSVLSVARSEFQDVFVIVVDNCSSDRTDQMLQMISGNIKVIKNNENKHFLKSVNQALQCVNTHYVMLLNNDAQLEEDTISKSLQCMKRYSDVAIVGGKVLHLDGYIQDAASIVFSDGSCRGLGRRMPPGHHLYNFERTVDYVSGALLVTTQSVLCQLNGLDEAFAPAYYEESDLCFRAAECGIPVIYAPTVTVKHLEFGSSVNSDWAINQMEKNKAIFLEKHRVRLLDHLSPTEFVDGDIECIMHGHFKEGPRILVIDDRIPQANIGSGFSRSQDIVDEFVKVSGFVTVFATDYIRSSMSVNTFPHGAECIEGDREELLTLLTKRIDFYDFIFVSREHNQNLFDQLIAELSMQGLKFGGKIIYDAESLFSIRNFLFAHLVTESSHIQSIQNLDFDQIVSSEIARFNNADLLTSVSHLESSIIRRCCPQKQVFFIGHPFPFVQEESEFNLDARNAIVFLGAIHEEVSPNHDSLQWMYDEIFPALVDNALDGLRIILAGNITCDKSISIAHLAQEKFKFVEYLGLVDDLSALFAQARAFIAPTRYAAGVPHKLHLASSYGVPSLSTTIIGEQIGWKEAGGIIVADDPFEYRDAVRKIYTDSDYLLDTRSKMVKLFNEDCSASRFESNVKSMLGLA